MDDDKMTPLAAPINRRRTGRASLSMATPPPSRTPVATNGESGRSARRGRASLGVSAKGQRTGGGGTFHQDDDSPWLGGRGDSPSTAVSPAPSTRGETSAFRRAEELWEKAAKAREGSRRRSVGATPMLERRLSWRGDEVGEDRRRDRPNQQQQQQQQRQQQRQPRVEREEVRGTTSEAQDGRGGAVARAAGNALSDGNRGSAGGVSVASEVSGSSSAQAGSSIAVDGAALRGKGGTESVGGGAGGKGAASLEGMDRDSVRARMLAIYEKHAPEKLASVDVALVKYEGRWDSMLQRLEDKYISNTGLPSASGAGPTCFMDIEVGGEPVGRLLFVLFSDKTPKAAENFRALCTGEKGPGLRYEGSAFHRIIPGFVVQGGDFTTGDGRGGKSIYGDKFADEPFMRHYKTGLLSMANKGKNTNNSQFFITLKAVSHLDGKHVVFGEMASGIKVLDRMKSVTLLEPKSDGKPAQDQRVVIARCGQLKLDGTEVRREAAPAMPFSAGTSLFGPSNPSTAPATTPVFSRPSVVGRHPGSSIFGSSGSGGNGGGHASASFAIPSSGTAPLFGTPSAPSVQPASSMFGGGGGAGGTAAPSVSPWSQSTGGAAGAPSFGGISSGFGKGGGLFGSAASSKAPVTPVRQSSPEGSRASGGDGLVRSDSSKAVVSASVQSTPKATVRGASIAAVGSSTGKVGDSHRGGVSGGGASRRSGVSGYDLSSVASSFASLAAVVAAGPPAAAAPPALAEKGIKGGSPAPQTGYFAVSPSDLNATAIRVAAAATSPASTGKRPAAQRAPGGAAGAAFDSVDDAGTGWIGKAEFEVLVGIAGLPYKAEEHGRALLELCSPRLARTRFLEWYALARKEQREVLSPGGPTGARSRASLSPGGATVVARREKMTAVDSVSPKGLGGGAAVASASAAPRVAPREDASGKGPDEDGASVRSSDDEGDEEERREERAKGQTAFDKVAGVGKSWIEERQFEALMEGVGTTYSVEDHKPKLLSISRAGRLEKEAFLTWYDEWLFGEDDSSDEEEEEETQGASAGAGGNTKKRTGFASLLKSQAGGWRCDACLVSNPESTLKCLSCETAKPGQEGKAAAPAGGGGFGTSSASIGAAGGFTFASSSATAAIEPPIFSLLGAGTDAAGGFTFSGPVSTASPLASDAASSVLGAGTNAAGGFTFGTPVPTASPLASDSAAAVRTVKAKQESVSAVESGGDESSSDEGDEEERREERAKAQTAFDKVAGVGKSWIKEGQFEALMEGVGTTYSVEDHKPKLLSISGAGRLEKEAFLTWYDEWLFGEDDSSDEEEEEEGQGASAGTDRNTKPGKGFASLLKSQAGGWKCDACLVSNPESTLKCLSCETVKPGQEGKAAAPVGGRAFGSGEGATLGHGGAVGGFTFGSTSAATAVAPTSTFSVLDAGTNAAGGFTFGAPVPTASPLTSDAAAAVGTNKAKQEPVSAVESGGDESSSDEGDEEERREERAKAQTAFDKVAGVGKSWVEEGQFEALMEGVGTTYSVEDHKPKLLSVSRAGKLEKEAFVVWYDEWLFGEDDSSDEEEEEAGRGSAGTGGNTKPGTGFASLLKSQAGGWKCDACLVSNPESTLKCLSCETVKPGQEGKAVAPAGGGAFGTSSASIGAAGGFTFGSSPATAAIEPTTSSVLGAGTNAAGGFTFGAPVSTALPVAPGATSSVLGAGTNAAGGFTFGAPVPTASPLASDSAAAVRTEKAKQEPVSAVKSGGDESSSDEGDEEERREERAKAETAFNTVAGVGKSWIEEGQFEALMEGVGTTYSVEDHKPKLLSVSRAGRLEKEAFVAWYDEWLFGEDDSSDEEEEEEMGGGNAGTGGNTKPGTGFASLLKSQAGGWKCDACLVSNPESMLKCLSCETVKPGQEGKAAASVGGGALGSGGGVTLGNGGAVGGFTFSSPPAATAVAPTSTFSVLGAGTNAAGGFTFGASVPTAPPPAFGAGTASDTAKGASESVVEGGGDESSSDEDEEERREERAKAETAFDKIAGVGKSWVVESQFEALMEGVGTTYSVEDHKPKLLSVSRAGRLEKEAFVAWYDEWLFGEDDSSDEEEEEETQGASGSTGGNTKPGTGFASLLKSQAGGWKCDACLVSNPESTLKCLSCETVKPGQEGKAAAPVGGGVFGSGGGGFTFGASSPPAAEPAASIPSVPSAETNALGGFTFGSQVVSHSPPVSTAEAVPADAGKAHPGTSASSADDDESDEEYEQERRAERAKAEAAFDKVDGAGKGWLREEQFEALMEEVGTTYSVEDHRPKLLSICRDNRLEREEFLTWYNDWLFGEDESSDEDDEEEEGQVGSEAAGAHSKAGVGFAHLLKSQAGGWKCAACLVSNPESTAKCLSCETAKPGEEGEMARSAGGAASSGGATSWAGKSSGGFTFAAHSASNSATIATSVPGAGNNTAGGFTFGSPLPTAPASGSGTAGAAASAAADKATADAGGFGAVAPSAAAGGATGFTFGSPPVSAVPESVAAHEVAGTRESRDASTASVEDDDDEEDEQERRDERAKAEAAFDKVDGPGKGWVKEEHFEALMEGVGTTYSVEDHRPKLLSVCRSGRLLREVFLTWYDDWLFGEDDSSTDADEEEEEALGNGGSTAASGQSNPRTGFASLLKSQSGGWKCGACLVSNPKSALKCLSCETVKPGEEGKVAASVAGGGGESLAAPTGRSSVGTTSPAGGFTFGGGGGGGGSLPTDTPATTAPTPDTASSSSSSRPVETNSLGSFTFGTAVPVSASPAAAGVGDWTTGGSGGVFVSDGSDSSSAVDEERERREERAKAEAAFDKVDGAGKGWVKEEHFEALMEGVGTTYSVEDHRPKLLSVCLSGRLLREAFLTWYDDWLFGEDDSSTDAGGEEEEALGNGGSTAASGQSNPRTGFASLLKSQAGGWKCGACLVSNPKSALKCLSCETVKPGVQGKKATPGGAGGSVLSTGPIGNSSSADRVSRVAPPKFGFVATPAARSPLPSAGSKPSRGFTFGSPVAAAAPTAASSRPSTSAVRGGEEGKRNKATPAFSGIHRSRGPPAIDVRIAADRPEEKKKGELEAGVEKGGHGAGEVDKKGQASEREQGGSSKEGGFSFASPDRLTKRRFTFTSPTRRPSALAVKGEGGGGDGGAVGGKGAAGVSGTFLSPPPSSSAATAASTGGAFFGVSGNEVGGQGSGAAAGGATWSEGVLSPGALQNLTPRSRARRRASLGGSKLRKNTKTGGVAAQKRTSIGGIGGGGGGGGAATANGGASNPPLASAEEGGERAPPPGFFGGEANTR